MTVVKYDVSGVEVGGGEDPPDGTYKARVASCEITKPEGKDQRIEVWYEILPMKDGPHKGKSFRRLPEYINLVAEGSRFRFRAFLEAIGKVQSGSKTAKGSLDTKDAVGKVVVLRVKSRPHFETGEPQANVVGVLPPPDDNGDESDEPQDYSEMEWDELVELAEERELDPDEIRGRSKAESTSARNKLIAALEEYDEEDDEPEPEDGDEEPDDDYDEWSVVKLRKELKSRGYQGSGPKDLLIEELRELDAKGDDDDDDNDNDGDDEVDYADMDDDDLAAELENQELTPKYIGRGSKKRLDRDNALEQLEEAGEDDEDGDEDDYDEWETSELKDECKDRGLKETGGKSTLIKRLREDDASDAEPV